MFHLSIVTGLPLNRRQCLACYLQLAFSFSFMEFEATSDFGSCTNLI